MKSVYAVRKVKGRWVVCTRDTIVMDFPSYQEAVETAQGASNVLLAESLARKLREILNASTQTIDASVAASDAIDRPRRAVARG